MSEDMLGDSSRDILIELRSDMKHVRSTVDRLTTSDGKQWEKIDEHAAVIATHAQSLRHIDESDRKNSRFFSQGFWAITGPIVTFGLGLIGALIWRSHQ